MQCKQSTQNFEAINCDCTCPTVSFPLTLVLRFIYAFIHLFPYFPFVYEIKIKPEGEGLYFLPCKVPDNDIEKLNGIRIEQRKNPSTQ